jgi:hypothetical protein
VDQFSPGFNSRRSTTWLARSSFRKGWSRPLANVSKWLCSTFSVSKPMCGNPHQIDVSGTWRGGRVVEGGGLEMFAASLNKFSQVPIKRAKPTNRSLARPIASYSVRKSVRRIIFLTVGGSRLGTPGHEARARSRLSFRASSSAPTERSASLNGNRTRESGSRPLPSTTGNSCPVRVFAYPASRTVPSNPSEFWEIC